MAILEMSKISVFGLHTDRKAVLEALHKQEIVEVCHADSEARFEETAKSIAQFDKFMRTAESALAVLDEYAPEKTGFFAVRRVLPMQKYHMASEDSDAALHCVYQIIDLSEKIRANTDSIRQIAANQTAIEPFLALDVPMNIHETKHTLMKIGVLSGAWNAQRLQNELESHALNALHFEILSASKDYAYVWFVFEKSNQQQAESFLRQAGFSEPSFSLSHHTPQKKTALLEAEKANLRQETEKSIAEIKALRARRRDIELFYDHLNLRRDKYQALSKMGMTEHTFLLEGFIPKKHSGGVKELLESHYTAYVELSTPETEADVPIAFQNSPFAAPVEEITETYSMPSASDIDPNPVMAFFYYLFFGMMFSDAGYGLLLMLACGYLGFGKRLEKPKRKNYKMFFFCGVSTAFWGLMYGSFFGNITYTVSSAFFGKEIALAPIWLDPISQAMNLLIFSVALGMVQILIGMGLKFYTLCRQKKVWDAIFDVGFWMLALLGICALAAGMGLGMPLMTNIGTWTAVLGAAGLLITGGRKSKNIFGKIFGGVAGLYGITGYVSDALSYCRLMALGLATGAIANVVNMLGAMFGKSAAGIILFVVIALFGHAINFAMNMLGAYVHTNRLQYVEFFSKFYEGGGRKFAPLRMNTKYCQFSEE